MSSFHNAKTGKRSRSVQYFFFESEKQLNRYSRHKQEKMAEFYLIKPVCLSLMFDAELGKRVVLFFLYFSIANDLLLSIFKANVGKKRRKHGVGFWEFY